MRSPIADFIRFLLEYVSEKNTNNLDELCCFFLLDEISYDKQLMVAILNRYNYRYLLIESPHEQFFKEQLPDLAHRNDCARILGHMVNDVIKYIENK